jgi:hypothetical protein
VWKGGDICALDLAIRTGVAAGPPGKPESYSIDLKQAGDAQAVAGSNLIAFLQRVWSARKPALVVVEAPFSLAAFARHANSELTIKLTYGLHYIALSMAHRFGVEYVAISVDTVRKHFLGVSKVGDRAATKRAVVHQCHVLGLMPSNSFDDNRADALALHDWASNTIAKAIPNELSLYAPLPERRKRRTAA